MNIKEILPSPNQILALFLLGSLAGLTAFANQLNREPFFPTESSAVALPFMLIASAFGFIAYGGNTLSPTSILFLCTILNLSVPALYTYVRFGHDSYEVATSQGLIFAMSALFFFEQKTKSVKAAAPKQIEASFSIGTLLLLFVIFYVIILAAGFFSPETGLISRHLLGAYPCVFTVLLCIAFRKRQIGVLIISSLAVTGSILTYYFLLFDVGGRINVAAMLLSTVIIASWMIPHKIYKVLILAGTPFGIIAAGMHRAHYRLGYELSVETGTLVFERGDGIHSVLAPFVTLAKIVSMSNMVGVKPAIEWFDQLTFSFLFFIPRGWWPEKPEGFGRVMVYELSPHLAASHHSMAGSIFGEFVFYAGIFGFVIGLFCILLINQSLNAYITSISRSGTDAWIFSYSLAAYVTGQYLTLIWGGLASFAVRGFSAIIGVVLVAQIWRFVSSGNAK